MKKQQFVLLGVGILILTSLLIFGKTVAKLDDVPLSESQAAIAPTARFNIDNYLQLSKQKLSLSQQNYVSALENSVKRGDVKDQQIKIYETTASFWKDSAHQADLYNFFIAQAAKLVNSEKNLTFAAQLILKDMRGEEDVAKRGWKAEQAISLFEQALTLNPDSDSLKVGLGSCYVFGKGMAGDAQETMKGIQQLLQVVKKDSTNMQAQLVLGIGGVISAQYGKAVDRLQTVVKNQPANAEAVSWLADAYAGMGDKSNALKWYEISKRIVNNPEYSKEVDERIKTLK